MSHSKAHIPAYADIGPVVDSRWLVAALRSPEPPALLDVRWALAGPPGIDRYRAGHLPGAGFVDLDTDLAGPPGRGGRHPLPDAVVFESAMRRVGLHAGQFAVVYDDRDSTIAGRLWWMLRYFGHERVAVLDGGFSGWAAAGLPVSTVTSDVPAGDFTVTTSGMMATLDDAGAAVLARKGFLLDARDADRYRGEREPVDPAAGHIPGARSAPTRENVGPDGRFRTPADLAARFAGLGLPAPGSAPPLIGVYCGSGVTAAHQILALELAGFPGALYIGSWSSWTFDPDRPVATGPDRG